MSRIKQNSKNHNIKNKKQSINKELLGIILVTLSILSIVSLHTSSTGFVGRLIKITLLSILGFGGYIFPYTIIASVIIYIIDTKNIKKKFLALSILNIIFITTIHTIKFSKNNIEFIENLKLSIKLGNSGIGGGAIGYIFSHTLVMLFGKVGLYILALSLTIVSISILSNKSLIEMIKHLFTKLKLFLKDIVNSTKMFFSLNKLKRKPNIVECDNTKSQNANNNVQKNKKSSDKEAVKVKVLDYTKDKVEDLTEVASKNTKEQSQVKINNINNNNDIYGEYLFPPIEILSGKDTNTNTNEKKEILENADKILETLLNFGIEANIDQVSVGPSITRYEIQPAPGVKVNRILGLSNDIALSLASSDLRIEAPIPGKAAIGIEVPNKHKVSVKLREIIESEDFQNIDTNIPIALGKDISGNPIIADIKKMPHLLVAGATGSGKSVCINTLIASIIYKSKPSEVKLLMIDPKVVELSIYNGIPHLLIPVVTDPKKASNALNWAVQEMTKRYKSFAETGSRDILSYNSKDDITEEKKMPHIVIVIDELADLMMVSASEVEDYICRLAQMARAAGIHLIVATQRPSVDIITGTIKANIPSRISFSVSSQADSRTILDMGGAEKLLGRGDMLFSPVGSSKPLRVQGAFISDKEVEGIVAFLKEDYSTDYEDDIIEEIHNMESIELDDSDELLSKSIELVLEEGQASISLLQRRLKIGYARAARIVDQMEERGIVGGHEGSKPRKVLISKEDLED